jgi:hypothetical protein
MEGHRENIATSNKGRLGSVPVMCVDIKAEDPLAEPSQMVAGQDHIIDIAEASGLLGHRVVEPPEQGEGNVCFPVYQ